MTEEEFEQILRWITCRILSFKPDILLLYGNKVFHFYKPILGRIKNKCIIIQENALNYTNLNGKRLLLLTDETEGGRQLMEACTLLEKYKLSAFDMSSIYLDCSYEVASKRNACLKKLCSRKPCYKKYKEAFENIKVYKKFHDAAEFHSNGILNLSEYIQANFPRPYNADATLIKVTSDQNAISQLWQKLNQGNITLRSSSEQVTLLPFSDMIKRLIINLPSIKLGDEPVCLLKIYKEKNELTLSPMVFAPLEFKLNSLVNPSWNKDISGEDLLLCNRMIELRTRYFHNSTDESSLAHSLYDIISFWLDVQLFAYVINKYASTLSNKSTFKATLDTTTTESYYGPVLGRCLHTEIQDYLDKSVFTASNFDNQEKEFEVEKSIDMQSVEESIPYDLVFYIKGIIYREYINANKREKNHLLHKRAGLSIKQILRQLEIPPTILLKTIDFMCDNHWTEPFNKLERISPLHYNACRVYNTTHRGTLNFLAKIIERLQAENIPTNLRNLNKAICFIQQLDKKLGKPIPYKYGKVAGFPKNVLPYYSSLSEPEYLRHLLEIYTDNSILPENRLFKKENNTYIVLKWEGRCLPTNEYVLEYRMRIFAEIYRRLQDAIDLTEFDSNKLIPDAYKILFAADKKRRKEQLSHVATAAFVDMMGCSFPELGLHTIQNNIKYITDRLLNSTISIEDARVWLDEILGKTFIWEYLATSFKKIYGTIDNFACHSGKAYSDILQRFAYYPNKSIFLEFIRFFLDYCKNSLNDLSIKINNIKKTQRLLFHLSCNGISQCEKRSIRPPYLPLGNVSNIIVVSHDLRDSDKVFEKHGQYIGNYFYNILVAWAKFFGGYYVNTVGDELIIAFRNNEKNALAYALAGWGFLNELCDAMKLNGIGCGCATGDVAVASLEPYRVFDEKSRPISKASKAAKKNRELNWLDERRMVWELDNEEFRNFYKEKVTDRLLFAKE